MTELLQKVIAEIERLPDDLQDAIAARLLDELADEQAWSARFAATTDPQWDRMAEMVQSAQQEDIQTMQQNLANQVQQIWNEEIRPNIVPLPTIAKIVDRWEKLFASTYDGLDPAKSRELSDALGVASRNLSANRYFGAATQLLIGAWKETGRTQQAKDCKIYRAAIGFYLAETYFQQGDKGAAFWWQLHALADDCLEGSDDGGAKIVLKTILGVPQSRLFSDIEAIAVEHRNKCQPDKWRENQYAFAEGIVVELAIKHPQYASMFAYPTGENEFPISPGYLNTLLQNLDNDKEGKRLEHVACYLFLHIPGCTPAHDLLDKDRTMQMDVVIRNLTPQANLVAETFGRYFGIECKNWTKEVVGSAECGYFLHRIHLLHFTFGLMLAAHGITGSSNTETAADEQAARQQIRRSYHEDGVTCIVLSLEHLQRLADERITLRTMLFEEIEQFRFGKSRSASEESEKQAEDDQR